MNIPNLENLIAECDKWNSLYCKQCPYNYEYLDTSGDNSFWTCNEEKKWEDVLFYLKLYQHLIGENKDEN